MAALLRANAIGMSLLLDGDRVTVQTGFLQNKEQLRQIAGGFEVSDSGALALVLLLDQFARNLHRGTRQMYAGDEKALAVCRKVIDRGEDRSYSDDERQFLYMPLMHSEDHEAQRRSLEKFAELGSGLDYARHHAEIVFRFGRFPHRNAILGRQSTAEEIEFLKQPGSSW